MVLNIVVLNIVVYDKQNEEIGNHNIEFKTKYDSATDMCDVHNIMLDEREKIGNESDSNSLHTDGDMRVDSEIQTDGVVVPGSTTKVVHIWINPVVE